MMEGGVYSEYECRFARLALKQRYLTRNQIRACMYHKRESGDSMTLEEILLERFYLTSDEADELSRMVSEEASAAGPMTGLFARIARRRGLVSEDQVVEALRLKRALASRRIRRPLGQILVERGAMTPAQVAEILAEQQRTREQIERDRERYKAFTLGEPVGSGPLGTVRRARHPDHGEVALKFIPLTRIPPAAPGRLLSLRQFSHENAARILDAGCTGDGLYVASEFVDGIPLRDHVIGSIRLPLPEAAGILRDVAAALEAAHSRSLAHGNLKPENVMVTESRRVKLTDFGLGPDGTGAAEDLAACMSLWRFMLQGNAFGGDVPALDFESARSLAASLQRIGEATGAAGPQANLNIPAAAK